MKINFILPFAAVRPIGGFKIVYEYADRLAMKGHKVNLIHPSFTFRENSFNNLKYFVRYHQRKIDKSYVPKWFNFKNYVNILWVRAIEERFIPDADVLIATAWRTAKCSSLLSASKGKKFYFIQGYETWNGPEDEVTETWKLPFKKIVISKWLEEIGKKLGEESVYIPNGLNFDEFGIDIPPSERNPSRVMMLYNKLKSKGSDIGIKAMTECKKEIPELQCVLFGTPQRPAGLPEWIEYYQSPERTLLRKLYNESSIFISPSYSEGFGLTPAEAMMSGDALAVSDTSGHKEFAKEGVTALTFEPGNHEEISKQMQRLINDRELRLKIAEEGNKFIQRFTWEKSVNEFEKVLMQN